MKILISGSRDYRKLEYVSSFLSALDYDDLVIVGDAKGVDQRVYDDWKCHEGHPDNYKLEVYTAFWDLHGNSAGIMRNLVMLEQLPDLVVAFWNGNSSGTKFIINAALARHINLKVIFDLL
jgi:hypothetical protein